MRSARHALNAMARVGSGLLARAPDEAIVAAGAMAQRILAARIDLPDLGSWRATTTRDAMFLVLQAITETPYGTPLEFSEPLFVTLSTSRYCPVGCANCYSRSTATVTEQSEDRFLTSVRQVAESRTPIVAILGGEPFLHPGLIEGVNILTDCGKSVSVATNWKVSDAHLQQLHDPRMVSLLLSLWGERSKHDQVRGRGSHDRILANARIAREHGLKSSLLVVINDNEMSSLDAAETLLHREAFDVVQITRKIETGRRDSSQIAAQIDLNELRDRVKPFRRHCRHVVIDLPELRPIRKTRLVSRLFGIEPVSGCGAGSWLWHIDSRGEGRACPVAEGTASTSDRHDNELTPTFLDAWRNRTLGLDKGQAGCRFETTT